MRSGRLARTARRHVKEDQVLADVMTDKATVEIPSPVHGTVKQLGGKVGDSLAGRRGADPP
jgi:pyruvate/2-oxoglutarate dehydrogenase complex dihydrolipoamide acyltransferase (E2) component